MNKIIGNIYTDNPVNGNYGQMDTMGIYSV